MALHQTPASMLKESLIETLEAAKFCSEYRKSDDKWGKFKTNGCLGYPGAILLFSIIDSIGSYYRKNKAFKINIESKEMTIDSDGWQHFKILNSKYFNQELDINFIKSLYSKFRSFLTHNSVLGKGAIMIMDNESLNDKNIDNMAFIEGQTEDNEKVYIISIKELYELCNSAVKMFIDDIDIIVPKSKQGKNFN